MWVNLFEFEIILLKKFDKKLSIKYGEKKCSIL